MDARTPTRSHDLSNNSWPRPPSLCKSAHNFWTWTLQGSCTALELQNLKISSPKTQPCASWSSEKYCLNETRSSISYHVPAPLSHVARASMRYTLTHTSVVWRHRWRQPTQFDQPGNLTRPELPVKRKKKIKNKGIITDNPPVVWAKITLPTRGLKSVA